MANRQLICAIIEAAHRAGMKAGGKHFADAADAPSVECWADEQPLDCYTLTAQSPELARLVNQLK